MVATGVVSSDSEEGGALVAEGGTATSIVRACAGAVAASVVVGGASTVGGGKPFGSGAGVTLSAGFTSSSSSPKSAASGPPTDLFPIDDTGSTGALLCSVGPLSPILASRLNVGRIGFSSPSSAATLSALLRCRPCPNRAPVVGEEGGEPKGVWLSGIGKGKGWLAREEGEVGRG